MARIPDTRTLILSPLQALARQHRERLLHLGIRLVERFDSECSRGAQAMVTTPERLEHLLAQGFSITRDVLLVVDECHCIEQWGKGFRPSFSIIPSLVSRFALKRSIWLSATLPHSSRIALRAALKSHIYELGDFSTNPQTRITKLRVNWAHRPDFLRRFLQTEQTPGIVFSNTRAQSIAIGKLLSAWSETPESVSVYHAGLSREERLGVESGIRAGRIQKISATSAFGMGMDFPQIRWVILWQVPYSILDLAQMIGRAGRNAGGSSLSFLLWDDSDFHHLRNHLSPEDLNSLKQAFESDAAPQEALASFFGVEPNCEQLE